MSDALGKTGPLGRWRRWRMGELDGLHNAPVDEAIDDLPEPPAADINLWQAELDALRRRTRETARKEGYDAGFQSGREAGYQHGLDAGRQAGEQEMHQQQRDLLHPLTTMAGNFHQALQRLDDDIASELVDLALIVGRKLAGDALRDTPEQILALIRQLLRDAPLASGKPTLWLHPDDLALARAHLHAELDTAGWQMLADEQLQRGGCRLTSHAGEIDASVGTRWQQLLGTLRRRDRYTDGAPL